MGGLAYCADPVDGPHVQSIAALILRLMALIALTCVPVSAAQGEAARLPLASHGESRVWDASAQWQRAVLPAAQMALREIAVKSSGGVKSRGGEPGGGKGPLAADVALRPEEHAGPAPFAPVVRQSGRSLRVAARANRVRAPPYA